MRNTISFDVKRVSAGSKLLLVANILSATILQLQGTQSFVVPSSSNFVRPCPHRAIRCIGPLDTIRNMDEDDVASPRENLHGYHQQIRGINEQKQRRLSQPNVRVLGMATALVAGTAMAWNADVGAAGAASTMDKVPTIAKDVFQAPSTSFSAYQEPAVTLSYLEEQIHTAEETFYKNQQSSFADQPSMIMTDAAAEATGAAAATIQTIKPAAPATSTVQAVAPAPANDAPKPAVPATTNAASNPAALASTATLAPKPPAPPSTTTPAKPETTVVTPKPSEPATVAPKPVATVTTAPKPIATATTAPKPAATATTAPKPVATDTTAPKPASTATAAPMPAGPTTSTKPSTPKALAKATDSKSNPSLYRYTKQHWPEWVDATKMAYRTAEPLVMQISRDFSAQVGQKVLPQVVRVEHLILDDKTAGVVDQAVSNVAKVVEFTLGVVGKAVPVVFQVGKQVVKATPEIINAGQKLYNMVDKDIIPELREDYRIIKNVVEQKTPEVIRTGRQVYEAGKQLAHAVEEDVLPKVLEVEQQLAPKLNKLEHRLLGDDVANSIDKTVDLSFRTGQNVAKAVTKNAPIALSAAKNTVNGVVSTGRFVLNGGKQVYDVTQEYLPKVITTTKKIVGAVDRTGGQIAYAIDEEAPKVAAAIKKEIPRIRETGGRVQRAVQPAVLQLAESGTALTADTITLVENMEDREKLGSVAALGVATAAIASAATSEDSFLVNTYGRSDRTSISERSGGFPSLISRSTRGGYTEEFSRRRIL